MADTLTSKDLITAPENPTVEDLIAFYGDSNFRSGVTVRVPYRATRQALEDLQERVNDLLAQLAEKIIGDGSDTPQFFRNKDGDIDFQPVSAHEPLSGEALLKNLEGQCQALWRTSFTLVCTLPNGHDGDHRADCGYTFNGEVDVRASQPPPADLLEASQRVTAIAIGAAGKHAERVVELEAEVSTLHEHLAEQNRLLSLNVAEVERLRATQPAAVQSNELIDALNSAVSKACGHVAQMKAVLDDLEDSFDKAIYPEQLKEDFDAPDDREYTVTITAQQWRALGRALSDAPSLTKEVKP